MVLSWIRRMLQKKSRPVTRSGRKHPNQGRFLPTLEPLDERILPATTASFSPGAGILSVFGDAGNNTIAGVTFFWTSSNQSVALVNPASGVATGVTKGSATITALGLGLPGSGGVTVSAGPPTVALLANGLYVDFNTSSTASEASNLMLTLQQTIGSHVNLFTDISAGGITAALLGAQVLTFPELEVGDPTAALTSQARAEMVAFVDSGGTFTIHLPGTNSLNLLNTVFGYAIATGAGGPPYPLIPANVTGTSFAGGPASLPAPSGTTTVGVATLPVGGKSIYGTGTDAAVAVIPRGLGKIIILGWDWFNAPPKGTAVDGGWVEVVRRANIY